MSLSFDFSQTPDDPTKIQDGGDDRPSPGRGMILITEWNECGGVNGAAHELKYEIVGWTTPGDVGKSHKENIFHKDKTGKGFPMKRLTCLAMAAGLFNANDVRRWKAQNVQPDIDMTKLVGRPIMIELVEEPNSDPAKRSYLNIGNIGLAMYHIRDPRVKDWPKNQSIYNRLAAEVGDWIVDKPAGASSKPKDAAGPSDPFAAVT